MYTNLSTISIFFSDLSCDHIWDIFFLFVIFYSLSSLPYFLLSLSLLHTQVHYNTWPCHIFLCTIYIFLYHQQYRKNDLFQSFSLCDCVMWGNYQWKLSNHKNHAVSRNTTFRFAIDWWGSLIQVVGMKSDPCPRYYIWGLTLGFGLLGKS